VRVSYIFLCVSLLEIEGDVDFSSSASADIRGSRVRLAFGVRDFGSTAHPGRRWTGRIHRRFGRCRARCASRRDQLGCNRDERCQHGHRRAARRARRRLARITARRDVGFVLDVHPGRGVHPGERVPSGRVGLRGRRRVVMPRYATQPSQRHCVRQGCLFGRCLPGLCGRHDVRCRQPTVPHWHHRMFDGRAGLHRQQQQAKRHAVRRSHGLPRGRVQAVHHG
jgi:hypothetical protein